MTEGAKRNKEEEAVIKKWKKENDTRMVNEVVAEADGGTFRH